MSKVKFESLHPAGSPDKVPTLDFIMVVSEFS